MKAYTMTTNNLTESGNQFKEIFLKNMVKEEKITQEQSDEMNQYCFIIAEKTMLGKFWDKILWKNDDDKANIVANVKSSDIL